MIHRKTTKMIADAYDRLFAGSYTVETYNHGSMRHYSLEKDKLHDFLYEYEYEPWFLNLVSALGSSDRRALLKFVMRLHTGESIAVATANLDWNQRQQMVQSAW